MKIDWSGIEPKGERRACVRKKQFQHRRVAFDALAAMKRDKKCPRLDELVVYRCRHCHSWHIGHWLPAWVREGDIK